MNKSSLNNEKTITIINDACTIIKDACNNLTHNTNFSIDANNQETNIVVEDVINAIVAANYGVNQNYDFKINLIATLNICECVGSIYGNYYVNHRYNKIVNESVIKRTTSGELLNMLTEYISSTNAGTIKIAIDDKGEIKKVKICEPKADELYSFSNPFLAIINHIDINNLSEIIVVNSDYMYKAKLTLSEDDEYVLKAISTIRKISAKVDLSKVSRTNSLKEIDFFFNMNDDKTKTTEFKICAELFFTIKGIDTKLIFAYEHRANMLDILMPNTNGFITDPSIIAEELRRIKNALNAVRNSATYSLKLETTNQLISDRDCESVINKIYSRLYKNTNNKRIDFNQTIEYQLNAKSAKNERYQYTYGNIDDGSVYLVSRTDANELTAIENISVNTQFDYILTLASINADSIDCINKVVDKDRITTYKLYINDDATMSIKEKISEMFNSNTNWEYDADNFFNNDSYLIDNSIMVIEMVDAEIKSIAVDTRIKYCPSGGDYVEEQISLINSIRIEFNTCFHKAAKYIAPQNAIELAKK